MVEFCDDEPVAHGLCINCYARTRYWHNRSLRDKARHMKRLRRCEASLSMQMGNVRTIKRRKRA